MKSIKKLILATVLSVLSTSFAWATDYVKVTSASDLVAGDVYVIAEISTSTKYLVTGYGQKLTNVTSGFTVSSNTITTTTATPLEFTLGTVTSGNNTYYTLKYSDTDYLGYPGSGANFETATSTSSSKEQWSITPSTNAYKILNVNTDTRYIGRNGTNIGPYSTSNSYPNCYLFKKQTSSGGDSPSIIASNVNIAYNAIEGSIAYSLQNATGNVSASVTSGNWLTLGAVTESSVPFTCSANTSVLPRTASVTLSFTGASNKVVTVTQAGDPNGAGSENNPFTVAEANAATPTSGNVYISGIVSNFYNTSIIGDGTNYRYYISDDGTSTGQLLVYKGKKNSNDSFGNANDLRVGDRVVICGKLITFNDAPEVASGNYIVSHQLVAPTFYPVAGAVASGTALTISDLHTDASIYYTTDGTDPTSSSTAYDPGNKPTISAATTFKAIAVKDGYDDSSVSTASYTILAPVATPSFEPAAGTYNFAQDVIISCETDGATIYYTTNGNNPTTSSTEYTGAIHVDATKTIKAIAAKDGMANSAVAEATYTMNIPSISASNVNLSYSATSGNIAYVLTNPVEGGVLTAAITAGNEGTWMSIGEVTSTAVPITCSANASTNNARTATVTLTYTYNINKTVTKDVTITQAKFVIDYAELPFSWSGSGSAPTGITNNGVGTYASAPYLKFDGTGDYVILKINEAPGVLTYDIKGNGYSSGSTSTFKVQTSTDGESYSDLKTYTSLGDTQQESFSNLAETVRYVRWIYTQKGANSGGNVALGNISLAEDLPYIKLNSSSISVSDGEAEGTLPVTYKDVVKNNSSDVSIRWFESNGSTPASKPAWATVDVNEEFNLHYLIDANTGSERTAYFKVYGRDANDGDVYSSLVTINQAVFSVASLPFTFDGGKSDIASKDGLSASGLGSDYGSSPKLRFDETGAYLLLHLAEAPSTLSYDIKNNSFSGGTFSVQVSVNGNTFEDLKVYNSISATQNESLSLPSNVRYIKWVYTNKNNGNVALGNISVTAFDASAETITLGATLNNGSYWATFYNTSRFTLPAGAQAFTMNSSKQLYLLGEDGSVIPANTAVVVIADSASITLTKSDDDIDITVNGTSNILVGSSTEVAVSGIDGTPYVLGIKNGTLGFYKFTGTNVPAFKAYYIVK